MPEPVSWWRAVIDLVLPRACAGCGAPSTWWCARCSDELTRAPVLVPIAGLDRCAGVAPYRGPVGAALVALKERGVLAASAPLSVALAAAVRTAAAPAPTRLALVPAPSRPGAVRARGADVVADLARAAAGSLRAGGADAITVPGLVHARRVVDQTALDPRGRAANLTGALRVRSAARPLLADRTVVVVDDVTTTGATLAEAARALTVGVPGCGPVAAVVAVAGPAADAVLARGSFGDRSFGDRVVPPAADG